MWWGKRGGGNLTGDRGRQLDNISHGGDFLLQREMAEFKRTYMQHVNGMREERDMFSNVSLLTNFFN